MHHILWTANVLHKSKLDLQTKAGAKLQKENVGSLHLCKIKDIKNLYLLEASNLRSFD